MRFRALLFDLDGTLVDSHREICIALDRALRDMDISLDFAAVERLVDGSPLEVIWDKLTPNESVLAPETAASHDREQRGFARFAQAYRQHYLRDLGHATALFPGVRDTLERLHRELAPPRFSVVSNKSAPTVVPLLAKVGIERYFSVALGSGGTTMLPKPHPELLLTAAAQLGCEPARCVMIGDTALDVQAGKRAGMTTIAISHGMAARCELERTGADFLIDTFPELARIVLAS